MIGSIVTIVNRTTRILKVTKNGLDMSLPPGETHVTSDWVRFAKQQNPVPGTGNPFTLEFESLVGVKGTKDDISPISDDILNALPAERLDRSMLDPKLQRADEQAVRFPTGRVGVHNPSEGMGELLNSDRTGG
jgi:hypothetical protein